ncbi:MAG: hypothetical protein ABIH89_06160 [Elusimicrobiota bacterium]
MSAIKKRIPPVNPEESKAVCPVCGYFSGIIPVCVRCGARVERRTSVSVVRRIAIAGSVVGLMLLWFATYNKMPESVLISDITETMNNALVMIEGEVVQLVFDEEKNTMKLTLNDGTGNIKLNAFNKLDKFRNDLGKNMPALKDRIKITGSLNISQAWGVSMFLSIPSRLEIIKKYEILGKPVGDITSDDETELYWITADIIDYEEFATRKGFVMHKFLLGDDSGEIEMVLYENEFDKINSDIKESMKEQWNRFRIKVRVDVYRKAPQIKIIEPADPSNIVSITRPEISGLVKIDPAKIRPADDKKVFLIDSSVNGVNLGETGVSLDLGKGAPEIYVRYPRWERLPGCMTLTRGNGRITTPVYVEMQDNGRIRLRIPDFKKVRITEGAPGKKPGSKKMRSAPAIEPVKDKPLIDVSKLLMKEAEDVKKNDSGTIMMINSKIAGLELGVDGSYLKLTGTGTYIFIPYPEEEKIEGFTLVNSGAASIKGPMKVIAGGGEIRLEIADYTKTRIW